MADIDVQTPSIARVYDYLLGGKDNFAADRAVAEKLMAAAPLTVEVTRENRQFLARATNWAAQQGISQFVDLGCGMLTVPNTSSGGITVHNHSVAGFTGFFGDLELVPPGVVDGRAWPPGEAQPVALPPRDGQVIVGVAKVG